MVSLPKYLLLANFLTTAPQMRRLICCGKEAFVLYQKHPRHFSLEKYKLSKKVTSGAIYSEKKVMFMEKQLYRHAC